MSRLIDADALLKRHQDHEMISTHLVWNAPTVEAEPVRHRYWKPVLICAICSNCGNGISDTYYAEEFKYCPYCGAKMDEEAE